MKTRRWIGFVLAIACLGLGGCKERERVIPLTTSSDEARQLFIQGREALDVLKVDEARSYFAQAAEKDPDFAMAHLALAEIAESPEESLAALRRAMTKAGSISLGERLLVLAVEAGSSQNAAAQFEHLERVARLYPDDARVQVRLGNCYVGRNNLNDGVLRYVKALDIAPDFSLPYQRMGLVYQGIGKYDLALKAMSRYVELNPSEPKAHELFAALLMKRGEFEESIASYEKIRSLDPGDLAAPIGISNNFFFLGRTEDARGVFREFYDQAGDDEQRRTALVWLAAFHVHEDDYAAALEELEQAYALAEQSQDAAVSADLLELLGNVLLESGDPDGALTRFEQAKALIMQAGVSSQAKERAHRDLVYYETRIAIAKQDTAMAWKKLSEFRSLAPARWIPGVKESYNELSGRIALLSDQPKIAVKKLSQAEQTDPRVLYLTALAERSAGLDAQAKRTCARTAEFNEARFELAYVRAKAQRLLEKM
jgi:tetratricopeptide (TPR) repeat protein